MEVHFSDDAEAKLVRIASEQECHPEAFVREAVERAVHDEWFLRKMEQGIAAAVNLATNETRTPFLLFAAGKMMFHRRPLSRP
jgi:predicted transcriptional regulator